MLTTPRIGVPFEGAGAGTHPLTWGQLAILDSIRWLGEEAHYFNVRYHRPVPAGRTPEQVRDALSTLIGRHQVLRTTFSDEDGEPSQRVHGDGTLQLDVRPGGADPQDTAQTVLAELAGTAFVHGQWPLRAAVIVDGTAVLHLVIVFDHLAVDGWGLNLLTDQLDELLGSGPAGAAVPEPWQPAQQVAFEREGQGRLRGQRSLDYWRDTLPSLPHALFDGPGGKPEELPFVRLGLRSEAAAVAADRIATRLKVSCSSVLLAATASVLGALTGHERVALQLIVANRFDGPRRSLVSAMAQNGLFVLDVLDRSFHQLVTRTYRASVDAYRYGYYDPHSLARVRAEAAEAAGGSADLSAFFNDSRLHDRWPNLPEVDGPAALAALAAGSEVFPVGEWERQDATYFVHTTYSEGTCLLYVMADTAHVPVRGISDALLAMEALLVAAAFDDVDPGAVLAGLTATEEE